MQITISQVLFTQRNDWRKQNNFFLKKVALFNRLIYTANIQDDGDDTAVKQQGLVKKKSMPDV